MNSESKRERLLGALRHLTPDIKETLRNRKEEGLEQRDRPDFVWHSLLQSFATMGNARGWDGLVGNRGRPGARRRGWHDGDHRHRLRRWPDATGGNRP